METAMTQKSIRTILPTIRSEQKSKQPKQLRVAAYCRVSTDSEEQELLAVMQEICEYGTPIFWTHRESGDAEQLAEDFYHAQIGTASGTLLAINMRSRIITVFSDGAIYRTITTSEANTIQTAPEEKSSKSRQIPGFTYNP